MKLSNRTYDILKKIALVIAPLATFIGAVMVIWGIPYAEQITATLAAIDSLIGALLGISTKNYRATKIQDTFNTDGIEELYAVEAEEEPGEEAEHEKETDDSEQ